MKTGKLVRSLGRCLAAGALVSAIGYAAYVGFAWARYGRVAVAKAEERDALLDQFMPVYEVSERHHVCVRAPVEFTFAAACEMDLEGSAVVRTIFRARS